MVRVCNPSLPRATQSIRTKNPSVSAGKPTDIRTSGYPLSYPDQGVKHMPRQRNGVLRIRVTFPLRTKLLKRSFVGGGVSCRSEYLKGGGSDVLPRSNV